MPTRPRGARHSPPGADLLGPWIQAWEIAGTAPPVIAHRGARMVWGGWPPAARDRREYIRMGREKVEAAAEALTAGTLAWPAAGAAVLGAALAPVHRRVVANGPQLSRR